MTARPLRPYPSLPPGVWATRSARRPPFPLDQPHHRVFHRARHGLWRAVQALGLRPGDRVLMPAYHHGSEVEAVVRAGMECVYYDVNAGLAPDPAELDTLLDHRTRALHLIHYLGFPQDAASWRAWCDERGLLLIEDAAQAWLSACGDRPVGSFGDLAIFCAYKSFGVPDGGLVVTGASARLPGPGGDRQAGMRSALGSNVEWMRRRLPDRRRVRDPEPAEPYDPAADFALGDPDEGPALATMLLLRRLDAQRACHRRRQNYQYLLHLLPDSVRPVFPTLPDGAVPFTFPVRTGDKDRLIGRLDRHGISAFDLWSVPHPTLPVADFPVARALRASVVALPVHQELGRADIRRVARAVAGAEVT